MPILLENMDLSIAYFSQLYYIKLPGLRGYDLFIQIDVKGRSGLDPPLHRPHTSLPNGKKEQGG
jgi:hypothetical protein